MAAANQQHGMMGLDPSRSSPSGLARGRVGAEACKMRRALPYLANLRPGTTVSVCECVSE